MVKNDYHVIVCKILKYLYACLKNGEDVDSDKLMDIIGDLLESYADYITPKEIEYLNDNRYMLKVAESTWIVIIYNKPPAGGFLMRIF